MPVTMTRPAQPLDGAREARVELGHEGQDRVRLEPQDTLGDAA